MIAHTRPLTVDLRQEIVGVDRRVTLLDGSEVTYTNLDNAASAPAFKRVQARLNEAMEWYASVHRGTGFKSLLSTHLYDRSREVLAEFVGADPEHEVVVFVKNTTEAINKLANRLNFQPGDMVLTTLMEHHSNDLPWRAKADVLHAGVHDDGSLDLDDFQAKLERYRGRIKVVAVTGASNVTGWVNPVHDLAEMAHAHGALISVDCAQLFPHRKVNMGKPGDPRHLDFISISGHKIYAPFGSGALIGSKEILSQGAPDYRGGGTIDLVTLDEVQWADAPERDEAGSPNVLGAVALAAALEQLSEVGMDAVAAHEAELTTYALERLTRIPGVRLFGGTDPHRTADRLGVITFNAGDVPHAKTAAVLGFEGGIGVRDGCFCAHPYVIRLLGVSDEVFDEHRRLVLQKDRSRLPGMVRMSFGCYNHTGDVDRLVEMVERILRGDIRTEYRLHPRTGAYLPEGWTWDKLDGYVQI